MEPSTPGCSLPRGRWALSRFSESQALGAPRKATLWEGDVLDGVSTAMLFWASPAPLIAPSLLPGPPAARDGPCSLSPGLVARPGWALKTVTVGPANKTQSPALPGVGVGESCAGRVAPGATVGLRGCGHEWVLLQVSVWGHGHPRVRAPLCTRVGGWVSVCNKAWVPLRVGGRVYGCSRAWLCVWVAVPVGVCAHGHPCTRVSVCHRVPMCGRAPAWVLVCVGAAVDGCRCPWVSVCMVSVCGGVPVGVCPRARVLLRVCVRARGCCARPHPRLTTPLPQGKAGCTCGAQGCADLARWYPGTALGGGGGAGTGDSPLPCLSPPGCPHPAAPGPGCSEGAEPCGGRLVDSPRTGLGNKLCAFSRVAARRVFSLPAGAAVRPPQGTGAPAHSPPRGPWEEAELEPPAIFGCLR